MQLCNGLLLIAAQTRNGFPSELLDERRFPYSPLAVFSPPSYLLTWI